ncbi:hypothetical protein JTE90_028373 [Oedothorax gibbosus]|uniref:PWWP domain-containing protein n=1 Tax=Oedothorax gibbosus TaxID=931172 RepID=A0AAV6VBQ9_9ARAC|nr:hypothetical protein JTE90_028373 [Oedothorax gibbosus]
MESSEQFPAHVDVKPSIDSYPDEERVVDLHTRNPDDSDGGSVIDLAGLGSATEHYIELNGQQLLVQRSAVDGEYFVLVPEGYTIQTIPQNSGEDSIAVEEVCPDLDHEEKEVLKMEEMEEGGDRGQIDHQLESIGNLTIKEVSNGVAYVPDTFLSLMTSSEGRVKQEKSMPDLSPENTKDNYDLVSQSNDEVLEKASLTAGGPGVLSSPIYPASETEEDTATDLVSEHDSKSGCSLIIADREGSEEPTVEEKQTSFAGISIPGSLGNTVSVIHTTSTTYDTNDIDGRIENSNDIDEENEPDISTVDNELSQDSTTDLPTHFSHDNRLNKNEELLNQDDDSESSQTCGLDLTKESNVVCLPHDDTLSAIDHPRSRYGIMDSLVKDKNKSYYDMKATHESDDIKYQGSDVNEDTLYSSSTSTNVTEDGGYINENNSNSIDCNTVEEAPKLEFSNEKLNPEPESSSLLDNTKSIENCVDDDSSRHSDNVHINNENEDDLYNKKKCSNLLTVNDNSNSKNSLLSEIASSPQMLNPDETVLNSRQKVTNVIDTCNFDDATTEAENDSSLLLIQQDENKKTEEEINSKNSASEDINQINNYKETSSQKISFHNALNILDKEESTGKEICDVEFDGSADLFNNSEGIEDNDKLSKGLLEKPEKNGSFVVEHQEVINDLPEVLDKEKSLDESSLSKVNVEEDMMDNEESFVKTPKRVYFNKRKLKQNKETQKGMTLFSSADSSENGTKSPFDVGIHKETKNTWTDSNKEIAMEEDIPSNVQSRVSTTYKRKRKPNVALLPKKRSMRSSGQLNVDEPMDNEALADTLSCNVNGQDSEEANWGAILMETEFSSKAGADEPLAESSVKPTEVSDKPSTEESTSPISSQPSRERKKPSWFKMADAKKQQPTSGKQFDKLIKSPSTKVKLDKATDKKKLTARIKKQMMSICDSQEIYIPSKKRGRPKTKDNKISEIRKAFNNDSENPKKCKIKYVNEWCEESCKILAAKRAALYLERTYSCAQCSFIATCVNSLLCHYKFCPSSLETFQYSAKKANDPNKRQLLRGDGACENVNTSRDKTKQKRIRDNSSKSTENCQDQPDISTSLASIVNDIDKDDDIDDKAERKFGFGERDVVWIKRGRYHWPALVWEISENETLFYVIDSPDHVEPLKLKTQSFKKLLHTFDDVSWTHKMLENSKKMPGTNLNYVKAIQKANSYINRTKVLVDDDFDVKKYFNIVDSKKKRIAKGEKILQKKRLMKNSQKSAKTAKIILQEEDSLEKLITDAPHHEISEKSTDDLDIEKVMECIWQNQCNEHVLKLYWKQIPSKRHSLFEEDESAKDLEDMSWFGPLKNDSVTQLKLYDHFYELYKEKTKGPSNASYIYKVWIPEGIIKAISLVNNINLDEAELIFLKEDAFEDKDSSSL